jgi:drug/metabolite transporter (DMT)-like permease
VTTFALGLVIGSAIAHATWNYLAKASKDAYAFTWAFTCLAALIYGPITLIAGMAHPPPLSAFLFVAVTVGLHVIYFTLLAASYTRSDLSVVYPFARGTGLLLVPLGAAAILREPISLVGAVFIAVILLGVVTIHSRGRGADALAGLVRSLREPGSRLAALTGVIIAAYSLWDKNALTYLDPIVLNTGIFVGLAIVNAPYALARRRIAVWEEASRHPLAVVAAAILAPLAYLLVLTALTFSRVSYIGPTREIGIVVGTMLGARNLREPYPANRLVGSALIVLGVFGLALSP